MLICQRIPIGEGHQLLTVASSGEEEPAPKFISQIKNKFVTTGDECPSTYFGHNCLICPNSCMADYSSTERTGCPQNTLNGDVLTLSYFAPGRMQGQTSRNTRACG